MDLIVNQNDNLRSFFNYLNRPYFNITKSNANLSSSEKFFNDLLNNLLVNENYSIDYFKKLKSQVDSFHQILLTKLLEKQSNDQTNMIEEASFLFQRNIKCQLIDLQSTKQKEAQYALDSSLLRKRKELSNHKWVPITYVK